MHSYWSYYSFIQFDHVDLPQLTSSSPLSQSFSPSHFQKTGMHWVEPAPQLNSFTRHVLVSTRTKMRIHLTIHFHLTCVSQNRVPLIIKADPSWAFGGKQIHLRDASNKNETRINSVMKLKNLTENNMELVTTQNH